MPSPILDTGNDSASATLVIVDCDNLPQACPFLGWLGEMICEARPLGGIGSFLLSKTLSVAGTLQLLPFDINIFYGLRDTVFARTPEGRRYTALYETHGPEITRLLLQDSLLFDEFLPTVSLWQENLLGAGARPWRRSRDLVGAGR